MDQSRFDPLGPPIQCPTSLLRSLGSGADEDRRVCLNPLLVEGGHDIDQADIAVRLAAPRALMSLLRDTI